MMNNATRIRNNECRVMNLNWKKDYFGFVAANFPNLTTWPFKERLLVLILSVSGCPPRIWKNRTKTLGMALGTLTNQPEIFMHIQESEIDQNDLPGIFQDSQRIQKKKTSQRIVKNIRFQKDIDNLSSCTIWRIFTVI